MTQPHPNEVYYDSFAPGYEAERAGKRRGGYHDLLDELEADFVRSFGENRDVLEVGCGTGLVLQRIAQFARRAEGVDLSERMLDRARARGLGVRKADATALPFDDASFDVTCALKVLPHVEQVQKALGEMARVTRRGGHLIAEFYNPWSLRTALKHVLRPGRVSSRLDESHVFTRYDSPRAARLLLPSSCDVVRCRGLRIVTPAARAMQVPGLKVALGRAERALCDTALAHFAGFWLVAARVR